MDGAVKKQEGASNATKALFRALSKERTASEVVETAV